MRQQESRPLAGNEKSGGARRQTITTSMIPRTIKLMDGAVLLAHDLAVRAARTGRAHDACAATHLTQAAHHAWQAAEALSESEVAP